MGQERNWPCPRSGCELVGDQTGEQNGRKSERKQYQCRIFKLHCAAKQSKYHSFNLLVKASIIQVELNIIEGLLYIDEGYINCELAIYWWTHQGISFPRLLILFHCENVITFGPVILNALKRWEPPKRYESSFLVLHPGWPQMFNNGWCIKFSHSKNRLKKKKILAPTCPFFVPLFH